jgi:hypothetical protein
MPRFPVLCSGCHRSTPAPTEPEVISRKVADSPILSSSSSGSGSSGRNDADAPSPQSACKANFRTAALAVQWSNRLVRSTSRMQPAEAVGGGSTETLAEGRSSTRRSTIAERLRRRTQHRLTVKRVSQRLSTSGDMDEQIRELMSLLEPGMPLGDLSDFAKAYGDEAFCRRLLGKYPGNAQKCAEKLRQALVWREQHRVLLTTRACPQGGDYRVIGADWEQRPVLYMCMRNQLLPLGQCVDFMVVAMLRAVDNMPAGVETATHIWDLHGMMLRLNWNPAPLVAILKMAEGYFAERMHQLIIIDMPKMAGFLKDAVWPLLPEKTAAKVKFLTAAEAQAFVGESCPADVSGRIHSSMDQNRDSRVSLEERKRSWMCVNEEGAVVPAFA